MRDHRPPAPVGGTSRRRLLAVGTLGALGLPLLAACTDLEGGAGAAFEDLGVTPRWLREQDGPALSAPSGSERLKAPQGRLGVSGSRLEKSFSAEEIADLLNLFEEQEEGATAPEGETFLLAQLEFRGDPWAVWSDPGRIAQSLSSAGFDYRIVVQRADGPMSFALQDSSFDVPFLVRVPEDPAPEDAVVEVSGAGMVQRLSLIDGTVVHTDLAHLAGRTVVGTVEQLDEDDEGGEATSAYLDGDDGSRDVLQISTQAAWTTPFAADHGWAGEGVQFLAVSVRLEQRVILPDPRSALFLPAQVSSAELVTPEGSAVEPVAQELGVRERSVGRRYAGDDTWTAWFRVPVDLDSAQVRVVAAPFPRRPGLVEELDGGVVAALSVTLEPEEA